MDFYKRWVPWMVYTVTRKELDEWFEHLGSNAFYNGYLWEPKVKRLSGKYVEVRFKKWDGYKD